MTPAELVKSLQDLSASMDRADLVSAQAAREALAGFTVRGHRMQMSGSRVRIAGPAAPAVAEVVAKKAGSAAEKAVRELLP